MENVIKHFMLAVWGDLEIIYFWSIWNLLSLGMGKGRVDRSWSMCQVEGKGTWEREEMEDIEESLLEVNLDPGQRLWNKCTGET